MINVECEPLIVRSIPMKIEFEIYDKRPWDKIKKRWKFLKF